MLNYAEFKKEFVTNCQDLLAAIAAGSGHKDVELEERRITKAQRGELAGLIFRAPDTVGAPTYYVEDFYDMYKEGRSTEELSLTVVQNAFHHLDRPPVLPEFDLDTLRDSMDDSTRFGVRLLNGSENRVYLMDIPHVRECGLALIAEMRSGEYRAVITNSLLESLGITKEELFDRALEDALKNDRATLFELSDMFLCEQGECENLLDDGAAADLPLPASLYVLSNEDCCWGAASLLYPGMLKKLSELMGGNFFVLPSSVHEVLLLPAGEGDPRKLVDIIRDANRTVTESDVFLADELYICESGKLRQASFGGVVPTPGTLPN